MQFVLPPCCWQSCDHNCCFTVGTLHLQADDRAGSWLSGWTAVVQVIAQAFTFHTSLKDCKHCLHLTSVKAYAKSVLLMHVASCSSLGQHFQMHCPEAVRQRSSMNGCDFCRCDLFDARAALGSDATLQERILYRRWGASFCALANESNASTLR